MESSTPRAERTPRGQGELLRERLLDAALALIDDQGDVSQVSIRAVTKRAGVSPTAFYLHFESREELLLACVDRCFVAFRDRVRAAAAGAADPRERLLQSGLGYIAFAREQPERYALIFGASSHPPSTEAMEPHGKPASADDAFGDLIALVLGHLTAEDPRREEADILAKGIWSGLHGYVTLRHSRPGMDWPSDEEFAGRLASAWLGEPAGS